ncbi:MAG: transposase [Bryobacterales bacterium]|nr:transposase [Bryobacterales bacterium]
MQLKTILNQVYRLPGFVYGKIRLVPAEEEGARPRVEVEVRPRANGRARCSGCGERAPGYDSLQPRRFRFVPVLGLPTFFVYAMRRVNCPRCGRVRVERVPWADGKRRSTRALDWFLASWARRLSWKETAEVFGVSWDRVHRAVGMAVAWGRERVSLEGIATIGVDEIAWQSGHRYLTLVYQLDAGRRRLLWVGRDRRITTLESFFTWFGKAIDQVRAAEAKQLKAQGRQPVLKHSRWLLLKRPERLTEEQEPKLAELLKHNLRTVRAYLLKEDFQQLWDLRSPTQANRFIKRWCRRAMRSRIKPMQQAARMVRKHRPLILNWFRTGRAFSAGAVEGMNNKAKVALRRAYGFRSYKSYELALYHTLADLPQHTLAHRFC